MAKLSKQTVKNVFLDLIDEPKGIVRMEIDTGYISELAQSISEIGLLQPILLAIDGDRYEIVAGHCRFLACKKLELLSIKAFVRQMTQVEIGVARATENITRRDLTPIEEAATYKSLLDEYGLSYEEIARKIGKTPGTIKRRLDLLKMPPQLQKAVHSKSISISVAEQLWTISDQTDLDYYLSFALDGGCTKEVARSWAKDWRDKIRRQKDSGVVGGGDVAPTEPRPVYVSCDLCNGPMELGQETVLRLCSDCIEIIKRRLEKRRV